MQTLGHMLALQMRGLNPSFRPTVAVLLNILQLVGPAFETRSTAEQWGLFRAV